MDFLTVIALIVALIVIVVLIAFSIRIVKQWERVVVLYLGKFVGIRGPDLIVIIPFLNTIPLLFWQVFDVQ
jgi:regulator of protease activity HflC (stomatin/prohibitin superfamily)